MGSSPPPKSATDDNDRSIILRWTFNRRIFGSYVYFPPRFHIFSRHGRTDVLALNISGYQPVKGLIIIIIITVIVSNAIPYENDTDISVQSYACNFVGTRETGKPISSQLYIKPQSKISIFPPPIVPHESQLFLYILYEEHTRVSSFSPPLPRSSITVTPGHLSS